MKLIIRNDDVSVDTNLEHFKKFCDLCDKYDVKLIHGVTPIGLTHGIEKAWSNTQILSYSKSLLISYSIDLLEYLKERNLKGDKFAVHGLWHTHHVTSYEIHISRVLIENLIGTSVQHVIWPFNEVGEYLEGLTYLENNDRIEDYIPKMPKFNQIPTTEIVYLHDWRFDGSWYSLEQLESCFIRLLKNQ